MTDEQCKAIVDALEKIARAIDNNKHPNDPGHALRVILNNTFPLDMNAKEGEGSDE